MHTSTVRSLSPEWQLPHMAPAALLEAQQRVLSILASSAPLADALSEIARFAEACIPGMFGSILYYDAHRGALRRGGYGALPDSFAAVVDGLVPGPAAGSCGTCAYRNERVISVDVFVDPLWDGFHDLCRQYGIRSAWSSPLQSSRDGSLLGVFGMYHPEPRIPSEEELKVVDYFVHLAAIAAQRHRDDQEKDYAASHDPLTGLGNRRLLDVEGNQWLATCRRRGLPMTVAFLDLDHFKSFNDAYGHLRGDALLSGFAHRLRAALPDAGPLVRFGGDEFLAFLPLDEAQARNKLDALRAGLRSDPFTELDGTTFTVSCGLYTVDKDDADLDKILVRADQAVHQAKARGGNTCASYSLEESQDLLRRQQIAKHLETAMARGQIRAQLQPIMRLTDNKAAGFELLFRTSAADLMGYSIPECISVAEEYGLIHAIGLGILKDAMALSVREAERLRGLILNVNVSVMQLVRSEFLQDVEAALRETGADPSNLCIEVTESHWLDVGGPARGSLLGLDELGFRLALDDFGTGYASLAYLQALPLDSIKIDRRFINGVHDKGSRDAALCRALVSMGQATKLRVVAEGVERREQVSALIDMGYELAQGWLWERAMPEEIAMAWLDVQNAPEGSFSLTA